MSENPLIQECFERIQQEGLEINLFNVYQGIPISYPAKLLETGTESIRISTDQLQIVCLYREHETYLQCPAFKEIIKSRVIDLDVARLEAELSDFKLIHSQIGERTQVRVWPKHPILGRIRTKELDDPLYGELADISRGGLAFYLEEKQFHPQVFVKDAELTITLQLPGSYEVPSDPDTDEMTDSLLSVFESTQLSHYHGSQPASEGHGTQWVSLPESRINGVIVYALHQPGSWRYRVGVRLHPSDASWQVIDQFISQRQSEIIREIREIIKILFSE